jgi:hypothetical protein
MERDAAAYADLLAGFRAFTLHRYVDAPEAILGQAVYQADEPGEVAQLRRLLAARPSDEACLYTGSAAISLEGSAAPVRLNVHHGYSVRWQDAMRGDFVLERGRELAEWLAAHGVAEVRDDMDESERVLQHRRAQFM